MAQQVLERDFDDEFDEPIDFDPEEIMDMRIKTPEGTYIYDPDVDQEEDPIFDPARRRKKRKKRRTTRRRTVRRYLGRPYRYVKRKVTRKGILQKIGFPIIAFCSFWYLGLLSSSIRYKVGNIEELIDFLKSPIWQLKDALRALTSPKGIEHRIGNLGNNPIGIMAIIGGLIVKYVPFRIPYKGIVTKILIMVGVFSIIGTLLDPDPNSNNNPTTSSQGLASDPFNSPYR